MRLFDELFSFEAIERVLSDASRLQGMLDFEAALAHAEARAGVIPAGVAQKIAAKCRVELFDLAAIRRETAHAGNAAIPLIKMLTELVAREDKDAARYVHWGTTSQDVIELNEAFASQALAVLRDLGVPDDAPPVNPNGGAIAIGHPLGASGARLVTTAVYQLQRIEGRYALCTMCIGVGQGIAVILERV